MNETSVKTKGRKPLNLTVNYPTSGTFNMKDLVALNPTLSQGYIYANLKAKVKGAVYAILRREKLTQGKGRKTVVYDTVAAVAEYNQAQLVETSKAVVEPVVSEQVAETVVTQEPVTV